MYWRIILNLKSSWVHINKVYGKKEKEKKVSEPRTVRNMC